MAKTVNEAFNKFNTDTVNLDPDRTKVARSSRDWLIGQLISLPEKAEDFPKLYENMHIKFGSFARNTKIRPLDDLCNDDGTLNSIKLVNKIVSSLNKIEQYKSADKHRKQEAATLNLNSYEWVFDIVPAFYTDTKYYIIPDGQGGWKATDPNIDQDRVSTINKKYDGKVLQLIRTLKFWNNRASMTTIPSYLFENLVLNFTESKDTLNDYIDINLINFWYYLKTAIYNEVNDPKGFQGNLNTLTYAEKVGISTKANDTYTKGYEAYKIETEEKNQSKSINKWIEIFGDKFPKYE
ncbi:MAG: hypothetical protein L6Q54_03525 [Leptospiraceae bacterium]|nr:hypothetical protein [Leptospiraceae bacterium]